ncbi:MAG: diaminopimelate decarboxylase [Nitrospirota bacterium]|nr:diaminopimelate decarboxylase [Nitrospirota bacterium]
MHHFEYHHGELRCEGVEIRDIARQVGTPFYLYSQATLTRHYTVFDGAFAALPHLTAFAVKACSNIAILSLLGRLGAGADIVSGGELFRVLRAGIPGERIVFSGVGKTEPEVAAALRAGIRMFSVESGPELTMINRVAGELGLRAPVALRVNPDVDPQTHPYISTGLKENKFGFPVKGVEEVFLKAAAMPHIRVIGVHQHIGSQITQIPPFVEAVERAAELIRSLRAAGLAIECLDIGGGIGIPYEDTQPPSPEQLAEAVVPILASLGVHIITEPGRVIAGNAGVFVTRVLRTKEHTDKNFLVVDGAMNDLMRPSLYNAYHKIIPVREPLDSQGVLRKDILADVVGPICESGDFLARNRTLPRPEEGELLAVMSAGAYGFSMSSTYNSRPRVPEVLVDGTTVHVIRTRETYEDLVAREVIPWQ